MIDAPEKRGLDANVLKYIAVVAMLIDHIAWAFVPFNTVLGQAMHFIGRLTAPIMCFFIAEGFFHTRNVGKYMLRLGIFAVISHIPFLMVEALKDVPFALRDGSLWINPQIFSFSTSVIYTLFLGLLALYTWKNVKSKALRIIAVIGLCILALPGDWMYFSVLWILFFGIYHGNLKKQIISYYVITVFEILALAGTRALNGNFSFFIMLWQLGLLLPPLFFILYNGKRGNASPFNKWFFYIFYPLHLLVIGIIKLYF